MRKTPDQEQFRAKMRSMTGSTDYGRPMKPFFINIPNFLALPDNLGR